MEWQKQVEPLGVEILRHQNKLSSVILNLFQDLSEWEDAEIHSAWRHNAFGGTSLNKSPKHTFISWAFLFYVS